MKSKDDKEEIDDKYEYKKEDKEEKEMIGIFKKNAPHSKDKQK